MVESEQLQVDTAGFLKEITAKFCMLLFSNRAMTRQIVINRFIPWTRNRRRTAHFV